MGAITLWGRLNSANVQKVVWTLAELGLDYQHIPLGGSFRGLDDADYRAMNPNGLVPTLKDANLVMWESHAIVRYLAAQYASGSLWPAEARERAVVDQWTDWTSTTFQPAWIAVFGQVVRTPIAQQNSTIISQTLARADAVFAILEQRLKLAPYLAGEQFTYADIVAGVAMYRWTTMDIPREPLPAVKSWHEKLKTRPAYAKAVEVPYTELVGRLSF